MDTLQVVVLSLVQGLTEFLPISSSAHLILVPSLTDWQDQGLAFDVALHLGTLLAVVFYFRYDIKNMIIAWWQSILLKKITNNNARLAWFVLIGTIPVGLAGLAFKDYIETSMRGTFIIGIASIFFGLLLYVADRKSINNKKNEFDLDLKQVMLIGLAQAIALIPGTSRSGITITTALLLGFNATAAARFSFLLSIPVIVLSSMLLGLDIIKSDLIIDYNSFILGFVISAISAFFCIALFLKFIQKTGMTPYVIYRVILGFSLLLL
ncbi:MAG: undecaprenyl-diphosphatase [Gammaproteobacteria bacterium]|nr:MAG: undecaprenyl-diphosphatase [Gammaproteobacteria bacterium]